MWEEYSERDGMHDNYSRNLVLCYADRVMLTYCITAPIAHTSALDLYANTPHSMLTEFRFIRA